MSLVRASLFLYLVSTMITIVGIIYASSNLTDEQLDEILKTNQPLNNWLSKLHLTYNSTSSYNSTSDFGDFSTGLEIFLDIITGNSIAALLGFLPSWLTLIVRVVYIVITVAGIASWIANRWI
ncbi:MAG: hypothetical protein QXT65_04575 [Candidatus Nitrosocaldaceae archaeon]